MSQQRNPVAPPGRPAANAIPEDTILDAARDLLLRMGMRRMTMADVARRAGVSRATLYRRWRDVRELVAALLTREWAGLVTEAAPSPETWSAVDPVQTQPSAGSARTLLVQRVVALVRASRAHPMLRTLLDVDPEFLLPYLVQRKGTSTRTQLALLEELIAAGSADGSIRAVDATVAAQAVLLAAWSFTLTGPVFAGADAGPPLDALDDELRGMLDRYLAP
ncbi:MAG TPA: helix-turn-helix domain-containing protein [Nocardioidaceae bacterium]|nr:helix-turn-helix domain-containing protein [Nocardioidaceae bacterium]